MIDIKLIRENPEFVRKNLERRKDPEILKLLDRVIENDKKWRELKQKLDNLNHKRNEISLKINELKKKGEDVSSLINEAKSVASEIETLENDVRELNEKIKNDMMRIPNLLHDSVPYGKDESENVEIKKWGEPRKFDFEIKSHGELIINLGLGNFEKAAEVSGAGFHYLFGDLALLANALARFAIDYMLEKGYKFVIPPYMLRRKPYEGVTDLEDFKTMMYKIEDEDLYLIATAEHPIAALYMNEILNSESLPIKFVGFSPCFRKEIGSHGVDTKGLFRVHQFEKVEQFVFCKPENSWKYHEELLKNIEGIYQKLEIPYRVVNICTGDIGIVAAKKYDLEAWSPRQNKYVEVGSCSNCTSYQARRLNIKYRKNGTEKEYVHTLNSTLLAVGRTIVVILENYQQKDGTVIIPKVLRKYMNGKEILKK